MATSSNSAVERILPSLTQRSDDTRSNFDNGRTQMASVRTTSGDNSSNAGDSIAGADSAVVSVEEQLSQDLATFLANPSLQAALSDGSLDLAQYSEQMNQELQSLEKQCIQIYRDKSQDIDGLNDDLQTVSTVLASLHEMLLGFQADLGGLSGDIRTWQEKSRTLDVQLRNRRHAQAGLSQYLQHVLVSPQLVDQLGLTETLASLQDPTKLDAVDSSGSNHHPPSVEAVKELQTLYKNATEESPQSWSGNIAPIDTPACGQEIKNYLTILRQHTVIRVRGYFLHQLDLLRRPQTNIRMIQQHGLLRFSELYEFLQEASPVIAQELLNVYLESMCHIMQHLFRTYITQLAHWDWSQQAVTRRDVIAIDDAWLRDSLTTKVKQRDNVFVLGNRAVNCLSGEVVMVHLTTQAMPYEKLVASWLKHLLDAVTNEHVFGRQFFARDNFTALFPPTLSVLLEHLETYLFHCYDAICLLLIIQIAHHYKQLAKKRHVLSLDNFFDQVSNLVWPRLKSVLDHQTRSLKQATAAKLGGADLHAHYVSRRFAEFCCSLLIILQQPAPLPTSPNAAQGSSTTNPAVSKATFSRSKSLSSKSIVADVKSGTNSNATPSRNSISIPSTAGRRASAVLKKSSNMSDNSGSLSVTNTTAGSKLLEDIFDMCDAFVALLERLSEEHTQKKRVVFWINNLDVVVGIFQEHKVVGKELNRFIELLLQQRELFVEEELLGGFSKMIAFVQQTEGHLHQPEQSSKLDQIVNAQVVESLVLDFAMNWKSHMEQINRNVLSFFSNFRNGMEILKQVLTQLLLYYTRFQDVIRKVWKNKSPSFTKELVPTNVILTEIKKYALSI